MFPSATWSTTGPEALLRQKRIAQMKQQPIPKVKRHILEKAHFKKRDDEMNMNQGFDR